MNFQDLIMRLEHFWASQGCVIQQPYDLEVGAGTMNPATTLRVLGPEPWRVAYVEPSRRPTDGRYGENPNRLQHYYQYQVIIQPAPDNIQELYIESLKYLGIDPRGARHPLRRRRLGKPDHRSLGARMGGLARRNGNHAVHVFPADGSRRHGRRPRRADLWSRKNHDVRPEGQQRLRPSVGRQRHLRRRTPQGRGRAFDLQLRGRRHRHALRAFNKYEAESKRVLETGLVLPAYDYVLKCSHSFNLLDARNAISVTERTSYISRVRTIASACCKAYLKQREEMATR